MFAHAPKLQTINRLWPAIDSEDEIAKLRKTVDRLLAESEKIDAEYEKCWAERQKGLEMMEQASAAAEASHNEALR